MSKHDSDTLDAERLRYLWAPELDPLFWRRGRFGVVSAWYGHVPFAHWIVTVVKPHTLVELGTHNGVAYSAFCEAVVCDGLDTRCFAVDTWKGDEQTGYYGEEVYLDFRRFHEERFSAFSELLRCTFDDALVYIPDASVDLLHIDGLHTYEAVRHDFETWRSKLSERAVVLFHDTNVRERDFGVWRLWAELRTQYPGFEFLHGHGLGVLAIGDSIAPQVMALCSLTNPRIVHTIRQRFSLLGESCVRLDPREQPQTGEVAALEARIVSLEAELAQSTAEAARRRATEEQLRARSAQRAREARTEAANAIAQVADAKARAEQAQSEAFKAMVRGAEAEAGARKGKKRGTTEREPEHRAPGAKTVSSPLTQKSKIRLLYISGEPDTPNNDYRVVRYVEACIAAGVEASWIRLDEVQEHSKEIASSNILVIWRAAWDERVAFAAGTARAAGARVVFDIDEPLIDPELVRVDTIDSRSTNVLTEARRREQCGRYRDTMLAADFCTVPTEELAAGIRKFTVPTLVLPNGFDRKSYKVSRRAVRIRRSENSDGLLRIGYAVRSPSHQREFAVAAEAIASVLRERSHCRLVLFRAQITEGRTPPNLDIDEFPSLKGIEDRIEWHDIVPLAKLPQKIAAFDVNIAPSQMSDPFCESKSELKYIEAALVDVPTVASPTGPYLRAIRDGETGYLARNPEDWYSALLRLLDDPVLRFGMGRAAQRDVLWNYGPLRRADVMLSALLQFNETGQAAARAIALEAYRKKALKTPVVSLPEVEVLFESDRLGEADVTAVVPVLNHAQYVEQALESVRAQTLEVLDLIVLDDSVTATSPSIVIEWARRYGNRFNRLIVLRNREKAGVGPAWDAGINAAETPWVLPLHVEYRLLPQCCAACLAAIGDTGAAFAYIQIQKAGSTTLRINRSLEPNLFVGENRDDIMPLLSKEAWAAVSGFGNASHKGRVDFCGRLIENGLWGCPAGDGPLAESYG